jgi:transglutaminase-like putative cysteine protease
VKRREFIRRATAAAGIGPLLSGKPLLDPRTVLGRQPDAETWRTFEVVTRVDVRQPSGPTRVWLPTPLAVAPYQQTMGDTYHAAGGSVVMIETTDNEPDMLGALWEEGIAPMLTLTSRVMTRDHVVDLETPAVPPVDIRTLGRFLRSTRLVPTEGIVKTTADAITKGAYTDIEKARAIYEWIVDHTFRDPGVAGSGSGDIRAMLESKRFGGKCADINGLYVGLARAAGLPARIVFGLRVARSGKGLASLGIDSNDATRAQHCRAEVYLVGYGWVPVDPADVHKVALEEPPGRLAPGDERVRIARARLFGSWEMNWIAYNFAQDVSLRGARRGTIPFFMYPQGETGTVRLDSLDPDNFSYTITVSQIGQG